jgi:hypothetical protein
MYVVEYRDPVLYAILEIEEVEDTAESELLENEDNTAHTVKRIGSEWLVIIYMNNSQSANKSQNTAKDTVEATKEVNKGPLDSREESVEARSTLQLVHGGDDILFDCQRTDYSTN